MPESFQQLKEGSVVGRLPLLAAARGRLDAVEIG